jgi:hypothetical protein
MLTLTLTLLGNRVGCASRAHPLKNTKKKRRFNGGNTGTTLAVQSPRRNATLETRALKSDAATIDDDVAANFSGCRCNAGASSG